MKTKSKRKTQTTTAPIGQQFPIVFDTFNSFVTNSMQRYESKEPSCFNGIVDVIKYKVTIEIVPEPDEVIRERLLKLWRMCDNHHHWEPLRAAADKVGLELDYKESGIDNPNHWSNRQKIPPPTQ